MTEFSVDMPILHPQTLQSSPVSLNIKKVFGVISMAFLVVVGLVAAFSTPADTSAPAADSELYTLAGFKVTTFYQCINPTCTDSWCNANCNHHPSYCPGSFCKKIVTKTAINDPVPTPSPTPPPTQGVNTCPTGTLLGTSWWTTAETKASAPTALVCCPAKCGTCAGAGCALEEGGANNCCAKKITPANKPCSSNDAPCVLGAPPGHTDSTTDLATVGGFNPAPDTELYTLAGFKVTTFYQCINPTCTDSWCNANCNHHPSYCPGSFCKKIVTKTAINDPVPTPSPTPPPTQGVNTCPTGTLLGTSWWTTAETKASAPTALVCCPATCGTCAGAGCALEKGGANNCCAKKITPANRPCSSNDAPCVLGAPPSV